MVQCAHRLNVVWKISPVQQDDCYGLADYNLADYNLTEQGLWESWKTLSGGQPPSVAETIQSQQLAVPKLGSGKARQTRSW